MTFAHTAERGLSVNKKHDAMVWVFFKSGWSEKLIIEGLFLIGKLQDRLLYFDCEENNMAVQKNLWERLGYDVF